MQISQDTIQLALKALREEKNKAWHRANHGASDQRWREMAWTEYHKLVAAIEELSLVSSEG